MNPITENYVREQEFTCALEPLGHEVDLIVEWDISDGLEFLGAYSKDGREVRLSLLQIERAEREYRKQCEKESRDWIEQQAAQEWEQYKSYGRD